MNQHFKWWLLYPILASMLISKVATGSLMAQPSMALYFYRGIVACDSTSLLVWGAGVETGVVTIPEPVGTYIADEGMFAISTSGNVYAWGVEGRYLLGDTSAYVWHDEPTLVTSIRGVRSVCGGDIFTLFLTESGEVFGVGRNSYSYFLGNDLDVEVFTPRKIALPKRVRSLACRSQVVALMEDGTVWTWGNNNAGIAGQGSDARLASPKELSEVNGVVAVSIANPKGVGHVLVLTTDGLVWAWGANSSGQVGNGTMEHQNKPVKVEGIVNIVAVSAGLEHSIALAADGRVWTWGSNRYGQLGIGNRVSSLVPVLVPGLSNITEIHTGVTFTIAKDANGDWWGWGDNYYGQLIGALPENQLSPVRISNPCTVSSVLESVLSSRLLSYPQPAQSTVTFSIASSWRYSISRLAVTDIYGNTVATITDIDNTGSYDVSHLTGGTYFVAAFDLRGHVVATQPLVILR